MRRVYLLMFGSALALLMCEILARTFYVAPPNPYREPPLAFVRDADLTFIQQPNQVGWIDDGKATINSLGLRGADPVEPKPASIYRVFVVGDSITFGWGVNDDQTYCSLLEDALASSHSPRQVEVVNGAVAGYCTYQETNLLAHLAPRLQPDMVLIGFYWNDLLMPYGSTSHESTPGDGGTVIGDTSSPKHEVSYVGPRPAWWKRMARHSRAVFVAARGLKRALGTGEWAHPHALLEADLLAGRESEEIDRRWARFESELLKVKLLSKEHGFPVGVVVIPSRQQVSGVFPAAQIQIKVREIAARCDMFVIDVLPQFLERRDQIDSLFIPYDRNHPFVLGHQIIANVIAEDILSNNRLPAIDQLTERTNR